MIEPPSAVLSTQLRPAVCEVCAQHGCALTVYSQYQEAFIAQGDNLIIEGNITITSAFINM